MTAPRFVEPVFSNEVDWTAREPPWNWYDNLRAASQAVRPGARLLDLGGGGGAYTAVLESHGLNVVVVDQSKACIDAAVARGCRRVVRANAAALPFSAQSFDVVLMRYVFHQIPERWRISVMREVSRILKQRGVLIVESTDDAHARNHDLDICPALRQIIRAMYPAASVVADTVQASGLTVVCTDAVEETRPPYPSVADALRRSLRLVEDGEGPTPWRCLTKSQQSAFHAARATALDVWYGEGPVPRKWRGYVLVAAKP